MSINRLKHELQNILSGESPVSQGDLIQAVSSYLGAGTRSGPMAQGSQQDKRKEESRLKAFAEDQKLWVRNISPSDFISAGAEQRVFIKDDKNVYKLNDAIYYASWVDYFHNLLLNNFFFPDTAYRLVGFHLEEKALYAVVEQPFVKADQPTDLSLVKAFLGNNGFKNVRNHDYYHPDLGIILEDLHDENVLTQSDVLYFIDTVFYLRPEVFWSSTR